MGQVEVGFVHGSTALCSLNTPLAPWSLLPSNTWFFAPGDVQVPEHLLKHLWHHLSSEQNQSRSSYRGEGRGLLPH